MSLEIPATWRQEGQYINRSFKFKDFKEALEFTNRVAELSETLWHHPDIELKWGSVKVSLTTHDARALTEKDINLAQQIDLIYS